MFLGEYRNRLDSKGRVAVPARFRGELGDNVIISRYFTDGCLAIYTEEAWMEKYKQIISMPDNKADTRNMVRILTAYTHQVPFDTQGRILVPGSLIDKVGLKKNCVFIGAADHIELWPEEKWEEYNNSLTDEEIERISESF